jgi:hypothetical protein
MRCPGSPTVQQSLESPPRPRPPPAARVAARGPRPLRGGFGPFRARPLALSVPAGGRCRGPWHEQTPTLAPRNITFTLVRIAQPTTFLADATQTKWTSKDRTIAEQANMIAITARRTKCSPRWVNIALVRRNAFAKTNPTRARFNNLRRRAALKGRSMGKAMTARSIK